MKLSPLSIPYRVLQRGAGVLLTIGFVVVSGSSMLGGAVGAFVGLALLGVAAVGLVGYELLYFRRYRYELTADTLDIRSGVFSRRNREIPLRRIQNVDISRNVVQRLLGIAAVNFETAGGSETEAAIQYVAYEEAKRLQRDIAGFTRTGQSSTADRPPESLFTLAPKELALVGLLNFDFRVPGFLLFVLSGSVPAISSFLPGDIGMALAIAGALSLLLVVVVVSWAGGFVVTILNYYGFTLTRSDEGLQYERGLLQRYDGSIPLDKVQTLTIEDNPLKRVFGYATLAIETAGYAPGQGASRGSEAAVPLATRDRVEQLANDIETFGTPDFTRPPKRVRRRYAARYLIAVSVLAGALFALDAVLSGTVPWYGVGVLVPVGLVAAHYKWKHRGYWLGERHVVTRNGVLKRETKIVPYYRIQTVIDTRTLFQRRWRLATVTVDTAGSLSLTGQDAAAVDVDADEADRLRTALDEHLRDALTERRDGGRLRPSGAFSPATIPEPEPDEVG